MAKILDSGNFFFKEIGIHPVPVPISKIVSFLLIELLILVKLDSVFLDFEISEIIHSTSSSVSGLGIKTVLFTRKGRP
ncbi:MAG: Uncharacterised protein [Flavobacterium sp. SCGC AAA160-P02]|nr:MAG: Uncharacterised protein [Flavobacterium sp. SCGC AAA160-P02]